MNLKKIAFAMCIEKFRFFPELFEIYEKDKEIRGRLGGGNPRK
jgi:hypothetical protein